MCQFTFFDWLMAGSSEIISLPIFFVYNRTVIKHIDKSVRRGSSFKRMCIALGMLNFLIGY